MTTYKIVSDQSIIVSIAKEFKKRDLNGIANIIDALFENNFNTHLQFIVDSNASQNCESIIKTYCEKTPYNYLVKRY